MILVGRWIVGGGWESVDWELEYNKERMKEIWNDLG
jgi:hypothetical protein